MGEYAKYNAENVLKNVEACIAELERLSDPRNTEFDSNRHITKWISSWRGNGHRRYYFRMRNVCDELSIFDWWNDTLSVSQLKQMRSFLKTAIKLGFKGYACFKVGATGCSHGMWVAKEESTNGYSPKCDTIFHSFRCDENHWDVEINGKWMERKEGKDGYKFSLKEIKEALA